MNIKRLTFLKFTKGTAFSVLTNSNLRYNNNRYALCHVLPSGRDNGEHQLGHTQYLLMCMKALLWFIRGCFLGRAGFIRGLLKVVIQCIQGIVFGLFAACDLDLIQQVER